MIWIKFYLTSFMIINSILLGWQGTSAVPLESSHLVKRAWFSSSKKPKPTRVTTRSQKLQDGGRVFGNPPKGKPTTAPKKSVDLNYHPAPTSSRERKRLEDAGYFIN